MRYTRSDLPTRAEKVAGMRIGLPWRADALWSDMYRMIRVLQNPVACFLKHRLVLTLASYRDD